MASRYILLFIVLSILLCSYSAKVVNIYLADVYAKSCCGTSTTSYANCSALNCTGDTESSYCDEHCCVNQTTCDCADGACLLSDGKIKAEGFIAGNGKLSKPHVALQGFLRLSLLENGTLQYFVTWINLQDTNVTVTLQDINRNTLYSWVATNLLPQCPTCYDGKAGGVIPLTTPQFEALVSASQWYATIYAPNEQIQGSGLLTKSQTVTSGVTVAKESASCNYSPCFVPCQFPSFTCNSPSALSFITCPTNPCLCQMQCCNCTAPCSAPGQLYYCAIYPSAAANYTDGCLQQYCGNHCDAFISAYSVTYTNIGNVYCPQYLCSYPKQCIQCTATCKK